MRNSLLHPLSMCQMKVSKGKMHGLWRNSTPMLHILSGFLSSLGWRMKPASCPSPAPKHFTWFLQIISQIRPCYLSLTVLQIFLGFFWGVGELSAKLEEEKSGQNTSLIITKSWGQRGSTGRPAGSQQRHSPLVLNAEQKRIQLRHYGAQHAFG